MANQDHDAITDPDIHEPKGVSTAVKGRVYQANGSGSGSWERPIELIASVDNTSGTFVQHFGLSKYREIIFVIEAMQTGNNKNVLLRLYNTSAASFRTSGYLSSFTSTNEDKDISDIPTTGLFAGKTGSSSDLIYFTGIVRLTNFNIGSKKTMSLFDSSGVNTYHPTTSTTPTNENPHVGMSLYNTAEAHSGVQLVLSDGSSFSGLYYTLWGIVQ